MKRVAGLLTVLGLSAALFAAGALGPFRPGRSSGTSVVSRDAQSLLQPAADTRNLDQTITTLQARLREQDDAAAYASLGLAYLQKARITAEPSYYPKAEGVLRRSLRLDESENFPALLGMGVLEAARHDFTAALEWGKRAKSVNPYNADIRGVIADALMELGRYRRAERALQKMMNLRPDVSSYARAAYFRELHGDVGAAIGAMKLASDAALTVPEDGAWVAYQLAELHFGMGRVRRAQREYSRGAFLAPEYALPRAGLAKVAAARGDTRRATKILARVVRSYPSPELVILLGDLYALDGRSEKAQSQYELVRAIAQLYRENGVNTDLEMALFDADHHFNLKAALANARAQYRTRPSVHAADALAWTLYAKGSYSPARKLSDEALRLGTRNALFLFHRGMIALKLGQSEEARKYLKRALSLNPNFSWFHRNTARRSLAALQRSAT